MTSFNRFEPSCNVPPHNRRYQSFYVIVPLLCEYVSVHDVKGNWAAVWKVEADRLKTLQPNGR